MGQQRKRQHVSGGAGVGPPQAPATNQAGRTHTAVAPKPEGLAILPAAERQAAVEERMQRRGLAAVIVAAGTAFPMAKARLIGGGPGREQTVVVI